MLHAHTTLHTTSSFEVYSHSSSTVSSFVSQRGLLSLLHSIPTAQFLVATSNTHSRSLRSADLVPPLTFLLPHPIATTYNTGPSISNGGTSVVSNNIEVLQYYLFAPHFHHASASTHCQDSIPPLRQNFCAGRLIFLDYIYTLCFNTVYQSETVRDHFSSSVSEPSSLLTTATKKASFTMTSVKRRYQKEY